MKEKRINKLNLMQDLGMLGFLIGIFLIVIVGIYIATDEEKIQCLIMFLVLFVPIILCAFRLRSLAYALTGVQVISFTIYRIYEWSAYNKDITLAAYIWVFIPIIIILSLSLFIENSNRLEIHNEVLSEQLDELVMIDPLTGLYNRRSLYNDLSRQIAYSSRNNMKICLMILKFKYAPELKRILSAPQFRQVRQRFAEIVENNLRIEDRIYAIDEDGSIAIILTCDKAGTRIVENRMRSSVEERGAFSGIVDKAIKVELKIGCLEYDQNTNENAMQFFSQAENELQYDV